MTDFFDDELSKAIRDKKGLPDNWRVYLYEAVDSGVRLTGALARPITEYEVRSGEIAGKDYTWIKPLREKRTMTVTREMYGALVGKRTQAAQ